jgi:hypothetical protein
VASRISRRSRLLGYAIRWLCGKFTGHQISKTEWGYAGGEQMDVWCRWCNEVGTAPASAKAKMLLGEYTAFKAKDCSSPQREQG